LEYFILHNLEDDKMIYKIRGQVEIIGLVFIVIIISVAMLFYISFQIDNDDSDKLTIQQEYAQNELSVSFLNVLLDTSVCGVYVKDLIADCATKRQIGCDGVDSCTALNNTLVEIKNATLDMWGKSYGLQIKFNDYNNLTYYTDNCIPGKLSESKGSPAIFFVPLNPGEARVELGICR